ncbi:MAG: DUF1847 domain-containing protein, partial [Nitrospirota bacterium]|nr:DUF1847 domain-containing protein [Nitrospirota bacterium]
MPKVDCAICPTQACRTPERDKGPDFCPTKTMRSAIEQALERYRDPQVREFARAASCIEAEGYCRWSRLEETMRFCRRMGFKRIGIACCVGLIEEARILRNILVSNGFEVVCVVCKAGGVEKETIGLKDEEKIHPGSYEAMCNPIAQAFILNSLETEFNIMLGLCVGHDSLFLKHIKSYTTVLATKDRVLAHNPIAALYTAQG